MSRHLGFQGSLSWYSINGYFGSDPYKWVNVLCGKPLGHSAHPTHPRPNDPPCKKDYQRFNVAMMCAVHALTSCCWFQA